MKKFILIMLILLLCSVCFGATVTGDITYSKPTPAYSRQVDAIHVENMEDSGSWSANNGTAVDEVTLVKYWKDTKKSIRMTSDGSTTFVQMTKTLGSTVDIRNTNVLISFYIDDTELAKLGGGTLQIFLSDSGFSNFLTITWDFTQDQPRNDGWRTLRMNPYSHLAAGVSGTFATALQNFKTIRFKLNHTNLENPFIIIDALRFETQPSGNFVHLSFDDGTEEDVLVANYMADRGLKGTFFVPEDVVGTANRLTLAEMNTMKGQGHVIANHSDSLTGTQLTADSVSPLDAIAQIVAESEYLDDNGFSLGARVWAIPGGSGQITNWPENKGLLIPYMDILRMTTGSPNKAIPGCIQQNDNIGKHIYAHTFDDPVASLANFTATSLSANSIFGFGFHSNNANVTSGGDLTANMKALLDDIAARQNTGQLQTITINSFVGEGDPIVRNITAISNDATPAFIVGGANLYDGAVIENNIFLNSSTGTGLIVASSTGDVVSDYNCFWNAGGGGSLAIIKGTTCTTLSAIQAAWVANGLPNNDLNSIVADPQIDVNNKLATNSPCLDTGKPTSGSGITSMGVWQPSSGDRISHGALNKTGLYN